ncbi:telomerase-binding protein EST1A isoform X3 [Nasonia vitripennis]|uniref:PIN domain-containing protein n=1 Tax=Nasonia vitripennis TaxID=7425 RepID=A0A7M7Q198_NASVI|nr:telomerase-binding protein EST1A isoform X3 [Nasonia vitripennis]
MNNRRASSLFWHLEIRDVPAKSLEEAKRARSLLTFLKSFDGNCTYFNMANHDKGRRKWGEISQDNSADFKLEQDKLTAMRGGGSKAPPRALYRPGSGPLRKSGRSEEFDHENNSQDRPRMSSIQDRLKTTQFSNPNQSQNSSRSNPIDSVSEKLNDIHINCRNHVDGHGQSTSKNNHSTTNDPRKKNKKPEQQRYVPKKVKEAMAEQEVANNRPSLQNNFDKDRERPKDDSRDWDSQSIRSQRNDSYLSRNVSSNFGGNHNDGRNRNRDDRSKDDQRRQDQRRDDRSRDDRRRDDHSKRFTAAFQPSSRNDDPRRDDPRREDHSKHFTPAFQPASRNIANRNRDNPREVRQGSEPPKNVNDSNRIRDTRSVEPLGYQDKFQGKPPSGKRGSKEITMPKSLKLETLPPRLQARYIEEHGLPNNSIGTTSEEAWDGSSLIIQGTSPRYPPTMQHSQTMQNLPPTGPEPPRTNWSNTIPTRSRGRGRIRSEELEAPTVFRPVTPDQFSAPSSRSHTPSQEYMNRSYDRRGSNSTMYTSMESLSRVDSQLMPPPASSPGLYRSNTNKCQSPADSHRRESIPTANSQHSSHQTHKVNNNPSETNTIPEKPKPQQISNISPEKSEPCSPVPNDKTEVTLDWYEEVELSERLEAEQMSRSSSVMSLRENANAPINQPIGGRSSGRKSSRRKKSRRHGRDKSKDKIAESSRERQNNQQNRENDSYNNNQKNNSSCSGVKRFDNSRRRNASHRSRETSKDRNYRGGSRGPDDYYRNRPSLNMEENWRTGRTSICESDDGRRTPLSHTTSAINSGPNSIHRQSPTMHTNSQPPGVLVLPDQTQLTSNVTPPRQQQQQLTQQQKRTLFDPNNPNKPIIITSPGSRVGPQHRDNEVPVQTASASVYKPHSGIQPTVHHGFQSTLTDNMPMSQNTDQFSSLRPSWYDPCSDSFRSAKNPHLLLDIERADLELLYYLSLGSIVPQWEMITNIRNFHLICLQTLLTTDLKFCQTENIEQHFWKLVFYNIIEILRKPIPKEDIELKEQYKKLLLQIIEEGTAYFTNLLSVLETTYNFRIDTYLTSTVPPKGLGIVGLALVSTQKILLFLGDLARYKELANESVNYGKSRQWYLKAQQINPKNGRPYSQLALLATYARRKLDAVYYYMRSLMASNPFPSARESLITMFDENRKKYLHYYESTERKRKEERESKERARMKEKEGANLVGGGLRREIWIHPGGKRMRRTTSATTSTESRFDDSELENLAQLSSVELNKRFVTSYLHVHGKLITRIGMETFQEAAIQMLREFRTLLHHSPLPLPGTRLQQLLALNMFAIETTQLKDSQMEQGYRSEVQERALVVSLQMFNLILERGVCLLKAQLESEEQPRLLVVDDMQILLPAIKIWCDWMLCHSTVWNPPPSCTDYRVGPPGDAWNRLATMVNLLEKLEYSRNLLIPAREAEARANEVKLVKLPEDTTHSGFTPLMSNPQDPFFAEKKEDMEVVQVCLRIYKILFFGQVFLCGLETPVLKLQKSETGVSEYVSVVEASSTSSPGSPPEQSDSELMVESYSEDENDESSLTSPRLSIGDTGYDSVTSSTTAPAGEIRSLIERKEELEKRQRKQDRHRQRVQAILQKSSLSVEIEVRPKYLVPDTNCFIDYLPQLQSIAKAISGAQPIYTLMVPLVVLNELEGLSRGADMRNCGPTSRAALNPEHVARVAENAKVGLAFARSRNPAIRCLTTRGTVLSSSSFTVEEDVCQDGVTNDDRILATCLTLCKMSKGNVSSEKGQPRRVKREVVLLTEDRNLRVKALARDVPVREVPDFIQWAGLG